MANALLLGQAATLGNQQGVGELTRSKLAGQQINESQQQMGQRNALFQQQQEDRQRQMQMQQQEQQNAQAREALAGYFMTPPEQRGQYYQSVASKFGLPPDGDHQQIVGGVIQSNPSILGPELSSKILEREFAPKAQGLTNVAPGGVVFDQDSRRPVYTAPRAPQASDNAVVPVADQGSPTGFVYGRRSDAPGKPAPAPRAQTSGRYSAKELQQARDKMRVLGVAKQQLANLKAQRDKIKDSISSGPGMGALTPLSEAGSNFDASVDQMRDTITGLTRTPGVGAMSDFETRLSQAKMPTRNEFESSRDQKIQGLEDFINNLEAGYRDLLEEGQQPVGGGNQQLVDPQDILDAADAILSGQ